MAELGYCATHSACMRALKDATRRVEALDMKALYCFSTPLDPIRLLATAMMVWLIHETSGYDSWQLL